MLFNSYEFIFAFLPVVLTVYFVLGRFSRGLSLGFVVVASVVFYAWWRPVNVLIIGTSLLVNFLVAKRLTQLSSAETGTRAATVWLSIGIAFNVCFLGYFKYINFARETLNQFLGTEFVLTQVILPLGISFITFQKIAFLIDVHAGRVEKFKCREFILFVMFFPQLIAGPIVHFREMMPQFRNNSVGLDFERVAVALSLFIFGLFKKVVLADGISAYVTPVYDFASAGGSVTFFMSWIAAVGFTLQMYFDFSGYSDMASGLALVFGVRLPLNFDSPLKARNIIDFWSRWHITLTRFLTAYVYNPLALWLTRRRLSRGKGGVGVPSTSVAVFVQILAIPTILTMSLSGLWHGAGFLFIAWGFVHGLYLVINHGWRILGPRLFVSQEAYDKLMRPAGLVITFLSVAVAMVLFRATSNDAAFEILHGMVGFNGIGLPLHSPLASVDDFVVAYAWLVVLLAIALVAPNTAELLYRHEPMLETKKRPVGWWPEIATWRPDLAWSVFIAILAAAATLRLAGPREFLYWQF